MNVCGGGILKMTGCTSGCRIVYENGSTVERLFALYLPSFLHLTLQILILVGVFAANGCRWILSKIFAERIGNYVSQQGSVEVLGRRDDAAAVERKGISRTILLARRVA